MVPVVMRHAPPPTSTLNHKWATPSDPVDEVPLPYDSQPLFSPEMLPSSDADSQTVNSRCNVVVVNHQTAEPCPTIPPLPSCAAALPVPAPAPPSQIPARAEPPTRPPVEIQAAPPQEESKAAEQLATNNAMKDLVVSLTERLESLEGKFDKHSQNIDAKMLIMNGKIRFLEESVTSLKKASKPAQPEPSRSSSRVRSSSPTKAKPPASVEPTRPARVPFNAMPSTAMNRPYNPPACGYQPGPGPPRCENRFTAQPRMMHEKHSSCGGTMASQERRLVPAGAPSLALSNTSDFIASLQKRLQETNNLLARTMPK